MTKIKNLYGLILAGGFSKRMGQDKALMAYHGKPQIEYVQDLLNAYCQEFFLSKRSNQSTYNNFPSINDTEEFSDIGPLGGILSAMKAYPNVSWLIMACDLPFVTNETLRYLIENRKEQSLATAFKSAHDDLPEPLCTIWEGHGYNKIQDFLKNGLRCPRKILINGGIHLIEQKNLRWLDNVNDQNEYKEALQRFR